MRSLSLLSVCCLLAVSLAHAAIQLPVAVTANGEMSMSAAFDGTNYLVALEANIAPDRSGAVAAQLVSQTGMPVGPLITTGQMVAEGGGGPFVAFDGTNYLLVWEREHPTSWNENDIYGQFISKEGALVGGAFPVCNDAGFQGFSGKDPIVFTGTQYLVIWSDKATPGTEKLRGRHVSPAGGLGTAFDIEATTGVEDLEYSVSSDGVGAFVIWEGAYDPNDSSVMKGRFVAANGTLSSTVTIDATEQMGQLPPDVVFDGTNYLVARNTRTSPLNLESDWNVTGRFVSPAGALVGNAFDIASGTGNQWLPFLAFDGEHYLVTWGDLNGTPTARGRFFSTDGDAVGEAFTVAGTLGGKSPLGAFTLFDGMRYFAVTLFSGAPEMFDFTTGDVYASFIGKYDANRFPVATTGGSEVIGSVASDGTNLLAAIRGNVNNPTNITAQRMTPDGTLLGSPIVVGRTGGIPHVAFGTTRYLLVWSDDATTPNNDIYGQFINTNGTLSGSAFPICQAAGRQDMWGARYLLFDGTNFLVTWNDYQTPGFTNLIGQFVSPTGTLVGSTFQIAASAGGRIESSMAFDGTRYLVAWQGKATSQSLHAVQGRFVAKNGTLSSTITIGQNPQADRNPLDVLFDGTRYLAVWNERVPSGPLFDEWDLMGRFITTTGTFPGDAFPVTETPGEQAIPGIAFDGSRYLVTWTHQFLTPNMEVVGRFFDDTFAPLGPEFPVMQGIGNMMPLAGGAGSNGANFMMLASYMPFDPENPPDGPEVLGGDVWGTFINPPATPKPDLWVRVQGETPYLGDNVYIDVEQTKEKTQPAGTPAVYQCMLQNDGTGPDTLTVVGAEGDGNWTLRYFDAHTGGNEITEQVTGNGWVVSNLAVGATRPFRLEVTPGASLAVNAQRLATITAVSGLNEAVQDTVIARTIKAPLSAVSLAASPAGSTLANRQITLTATPTGGKNIEYRFFKVLNSVTTTIQNYTLGANTCQITPTELGQYQFIVWAREQGSAVKYVSSVVHKVNPPLTAVNIAATPIWPQAPGTVITVKATPVNGGQIEYRFYKTEPGGALTIVQPYSTSSTYAFTPSTQGQYQFLVYAREVGSGVTKQAYANMTYNVATPITSVDLVATPASPQTVGTPIHLTAQAQGGYSVQYRFFVITPAGQTVTLKNYAVGDNVCDYTPATAGRYTFIVWVRETHSTRGKDAYKALTYTVTTPVTHPITVSNVFMGNTVTVYSDGRPAWSADGSQIAFHGIAPSISAGGILKVSSAPGSTPTAGSDANDFIDKNPNFMGNTLAFTRTWIGNDHNMHVMSRTGTAASQILRSFNSDQVGYAHDFGIQPETFSLSGSGLRAFGVWKPFTGYEQYGSGGVYALDFTGPTFTRLGGSDEITDGAISGDGARIAYVRANGNIYWKPFSGGTETLVGAGTLPSWSADGSKLGYASGIGFTPTYVVCTVASGAKTYYTLPEGVICQNPVLSPDGAKIAFRTFTQMMPNWSEGIAIGTFGE